MIKIEKNTLESSHQSQPVFTAGTPVIKAGIAMILIHGRGATAHSILTLVNELKRDDLAYLAPQAANQSWYPYGFMTPIERNQPGISSGLQVINDIIQQLNSQKIPREKIILLGFSQGACLALEYVIRNACRFGGVVGLSGGLIGPPGTKWDYPGNLDGTPVFLGCSDTDFHIPKERVEETAVIMHERGGFVDIRFYNGMGHTINQEEIEVVKEMIGKL